MFCFTFMKYIAGITTPLLPHYARAMVESLGLVLSLSQQIFHLLHLIQNKTILPMNLARVQ